MINVHNFKNLMLINPQGRILYSDMGNFLYFGGQLKDITGKYLKDIFKGTDEGYPALRAAREGISFDFFESELETANGISLRKTGCVYPVFYKDSPVAALEFANYYYGREQVGTLDGIREHLIFRKNNTRYITDDIISGHSSILKVKAQIEKYALSDSTVLIYGETGTGKELVAQALHNSSRRFFRKFISVNCAAIPANLLESMLFGTTKGTFTGAQDKEGLFEQANGGTLFLDEISSLDISMQVKILKAIESKSIRRIGSEKERYVNVRVIAAANEDLAKLVEEGKFKRDLYYRLAVVYITLPRLRDRGSDIELLANCFIERFNKAMDYSIEPIDEELAKIFYSYSWPGNVRELKNVIEGAFAFAEGNRITKNELPSYMLREVEKNSGVITNDFEYNERLSLDENAKALEQLIITQALKEAGGSMSGAAKLAGISKQLFKYRYDRYRG
ncbi:MAG: sigma 54-interacting transcriptional regulator [Clostridia bacterium]|nr:sigma 54-interacting transcriptional regulator [Clostridia bacterium]